MKVYRVTTHTEAFRWFHCPTLREAKALGAQLYRDYREDWPSVTVDIDTINVTPTRAGICEALDDFVRLAGTNEF